MARVLFTVLLALAWTAGAFGLGLAVNALRAKPLPWTAPFPYEHDCPEKLELSTPVVDAARCWKLAQSKRLREQGKRVVFVDARPEEAFAVTHLKGARSFPYSFISPFSADDAKALHAFSHVFVYCDSPGDKLAGLQAELMRKAGLNNVKVVRGGFAALSKLAGAEQVFQAKVRPDGGTTSGAEDGGMRDAKVAPAKAGAR